MIAVSPQYLAAQKAHEFEGVRKALLYRRLGDGSGWETTPIDVSGEVLNLDRLSDKLDTEDLNVFKMGNIAVTVDNSRRQWEQGSSRFSSYLYYRSKLVIELGMVLGGGPETFPRFTGLIEDENEGSERPSKVLQVNSAHQQLETADADKSGLMRTDELLGVGDGTNPDFLTERTGVDEVLATRVAGTPQRPGLQWTVSQLNDPESQAKVSFPTTQPGPGQEVRADYRYWKQNITIEEAVADLIATVPSVAVDVIEPVDFTATPVVRELLHTTYNDFADYVFQRTERVDEPEPPPGDAQITLKPIDTEAEWTGLKVADTGMNYKRVADGIHPRWPLQYEGDFFPEEEYQQVEGEPILPRWWQEFLPGGANHSVAASMLHVVHPAGADYLIQGQKGGGTSQNRYFSIRIRFQDLDGRCFYGGRAPVGPGYGAVLEFDSWAGGGNPAFGRVRLNSAGSSAWVYLNLSNWHTFEIVTDQSTMQARLHIDGGVAPDITTALGSPSGTSGGSAQFQSTTGGTNEFDIDFMRFNHQANVPPTGSITLQISYYPHLAGLTTFGLITTLGPFWAAWQGTPKSYGVFYSWSPDGASWSPEVQIPLGGNVGNWTNVDDPQYIRFRIDLQGGADSLPAAVNKLWLPGIAWVDLDGGTGTSSWDTWNYSADNNDGAAQVFNAAPAPSATGWSFYAGLGLGGSIQADDDAVGGGYPMPTHLAFIVLLNTGGANLPEYRESLILLTTSTVFLTLANYGRASVLAVVQELARISDSEIGVKGTGSFFFRGRHVDPAPVKTLDDSNVLDVLAYSPGWDRVYNSVKAEFGPFRYVADSTSEGDPAPTSERRYGTRSLPVGGGSLMFQKDVDLATVMAKRYWTRYKEAKRRLTIKVRWMPELELGDRVYYNVQKPRRIGPASLNARVIGIALDPMGYTCELEIMEI